MAGQEMKVVTISNSRCIPVAIQQSRGRSLPLRELQFGRRKSCNATVGWLEHRTREMHPIRGPQGLQVDGRHTATLSELSAFSRTDVKIFAPAFSSVGEIRPLLQSVTLGSRPPISRLGVAGNEGAESSQREASG